MGATIQSGSRLGVWVFDAFPVDAFTMALSDVSPTSAGC